jgi:hypothetical protein
MFEHFVGHVYVFREPPQETLPLIDVPIFTQPDNAPESLLIQIDEADLGGPAKAKIGDLLTQDALGVDVLKDSRGVDPRALVRLAQEMRAHANGWAPLLSWRAQPTGAQLKLVCKLIWDYLVPTRQMRAGVASGAQLAFRIESLRHNGGGAGLLRANIRESAHPGDVVEARSSSCDTGQTLISQSTCWPSIAYSDPCSPGLAARRATTRTSPD